LRRRPPETPPTPLFTTSFTLTCLATFFFYGSFYLILPVMPLYVAAMGGTSLQLGLIIGCFAFTAMVLRPPAGWVVDTRGPRPVLVAGVSIFLLASLGYAIAPSVVAVLGLRVFHGIGMGLFPTAATVVIAELAPRHRRGEAMGWFGIANSIGLVVGPTIGTAMATRMGFLALFLTAGGVASLGLAFTVMLPRVGERPGGAGRPLRWRDLFSWAAVLPSVLLLFLYVPYGFLVAFIPIIGTQRGLENPGAFYSVFALAVLLVRAKAGELSDRHGRAAAILPGMLLASVAFGVLGLTSGPAGVLVGAAIYGVAFGSAQPALMALTADRVPAGERGKAMGTFYAAWELGIAVGAVGSGVVLKMTGFSLMLLAGAVIPVGGAVLSFRLLASGAPQPSN
jgi:MFS family permease